MVSPLIQYLLEEIHKQRKFSVHLVAYCPDGNWRNCEDGAEIDPKITVKIRGLKDINKYVKLSDRQAIIFAGKSKYAVLVECPKRTRDKTLEGWHGIFLACINSATKSYFANHDSLTGVFNRHGIQFNLDQLWTGSGGDSSVDITVDQQTGGNAHIAIFAFDIDSFKAVNDTYTHDVGDAVLVIFSRRISKIISSIENEFNVKCLFGRPGGEEFELIVRRSQGPVPVQEIATMLLDCIRNPGLPSSKEIEEYKLRNPHTSVHQENLPFPMNVTASIGVAMEKLGKKVRYSDKLYFNLRQKADVACYRAKNDGKNCCRSHADIKLKHGRVLDYFVDSDLVVIDIGNDVEVSRGELFRVFFPPFQDQDIVQSDGRTSKKIGKYPLIESARITVKEVQNKVAICVVQDRHTNSPIPKGSLLHYVYTGSVPFPLQRINEWNLSISSGNCAIKYIDELLEIGELGSVISFNGRFEKNATLSPRELRALFVSNLQLRFPAGTKIFRGAGFGAFIVCKSRRAQDEKRKKIDIVGLLSDSASGMATVTAGIYKHDNAPIEWVRTAEAILFYASAARSVAVSSTKNQKLLSHVVGESTPTNTVLAWRQQGSVDDALVDYQKFKEFGASSASLDNQLGLALMASRRAELGEMAESAFALAVSERADEKVYVANLALAQLKIGKYKEAYKAFLEAEAFVRNETKAYSYFLGFAYSALKTYLDEVDYGNVLSLMQEALVKIPKCPEDVIYSSWWKELSVAVTHDSGKPAN